MAECESAVKNLYADKQEFPQVCHLQNTMAIICCEVENTTSDDSLLSIRGGNFDGKMHQFIPLSSKQKTEDTTRSATRKPGVISRQSE